MQFPTSLIFQGLLDIKHGTVKYNLGESTCPPLTLKDLYSDIGQLSSVASLSLDYGSSKGLPALRQAIADDTNKICQKIDVPRKDVTRDDVLLTVGSASSLFIVSFSLAKAGDQVVVARPNYPASIDILTGLKIDIKYWDQNFDDGFKLDLDALEKLLVPGKTKLVSITSPGNPSAIQYSSEQILKLSKMVKEKCPDAFVIIDETYRYARFPHDPVPPPTAASLGECCNIIATTSLSKGLGAPGIRMGWVVTLNTELMKKLTLAKQNIWVCNGTLDEYIGLKVFETKEQITKKMCDKLGKSLEMVEAWVNKESDYVEWIKPNAGALALVRLKPTIPDDKIVYFYEELLSRHKTLVAQAAWFYAPARCFRIGFGYPSMEELKEGLDRISQTLVAASGKK